MVLREITEDRPGLRLGSNADSFLLEEGTVAQSGKSKGQERWLTIGYYTDLSHALKAAITKLVLKNDVPLQQALSEALQDVRQAVSEVERGLRLTL